MADVVRDAGNILLSRLMGADVRLDPAGSTSGSDRVGSRRSPRSRAGSRTPFPRRVGPPTRRARVRPLGPRGRRAGRRSRRLLRHDRRLLGHRLDPGGDAGFAAQERPRDVLGIDGSATVEQTGIRSPGSLPTADAIGLGATWATTRSSSSTSGTRHVRDPDGKTIEAIHLCARLEEFSPTRSTRKSMAALIDLVRSGRIEPGSRVPTPTSAVTALNAYAGARVVGRQPNGSPKRAKSSVSERDDLLHPLTLERAPRSSSGERVLRRPPAVPADRGLAVRLRHDRRRRASPSRR